MKNKKEIREVLFFLTYHSNLFSIEGQNVLPMSLKLPEGVYANIKPLE